MGRLEIAGMALPVDRLAAMALGFFVLANLFAPRSFRFAAVFLGLGACLLLAIALYVAFHRLRGTDQAGPPTPSMHLVFVGFIVIPGSALPLGDFDNKDHPDGNLSIRQEMPRGVEFPSWARIP